MAGNEARQAKTDQAERDWYIKQMGEPSGDAGSEADDEMGTTILGDINHPQPVVIQPPPPSNLMPLALLALATAIPITGAIGTAGYMLANRDRPPTATQPSFDDSTVKIGLGRIEDLE